MTSTAAYELARRWSCCAEQFANEAASSALHRQRVSVHTASRDLAQKLKKSQASAEARAGGGALEENGDDQMQDGLRGAELPLRLGEK